MMKITRHIAARTQVIKVEWCKKDFMEMSKKFRDIRSKSKKPMDRCGLCRHAFADGEMMGLACFEKGGNKTVCQSCADELIASENKDTE